uniref:Transmembrane protein n=1 Tax=Plectus sambesii TaxID=2011161 RepID=A0A914VBI1_9BILA
MLKLVSRGLLLSFVTFFSVADTVSANRHRHSRSQHHHQTPESSINSPCTLPSILNASFESVCAANLKKRFICTLPASILLPVTLWTHLEEVIAGRFAFCRYDSLQKVALREPIGDDELIKQWQRMEDARLERLREAQRHLSEVKDLLYHLLLHLVALLESEYPVGAQPIQHTVPFWALCSFVGCILLSAIAAFVGNCVTNRGGLRASTHGKIPGVSRSWRAGFSGGMWGAS